MTHRAVGVCIGASTISAVELVKGGDRRKVNRVLVRPHEGNPRAVLNQVLDALGDGGTPILATGRAFRGFTTLPCVTEPEAAECAVRSLSGGSRRFDAVLSAGGETFLVYQLDGQLRIAGISSGTKCASGTGEFFLQQIGRMNLGIEEAATQAVDGTPYLLNGRCSVFCKSDCTHALNQGEPMPNIVAGLCGMVARRMAELLEGVPCRSVLLVGGVAQNRVVVELLKSRLAQREPAVGLTVPEEARYFEALGAAILAFDRGRARPARLFVPRSSSFTFLPRLDSFVPMVTFQTTARGIFEPGDRCVVGLDVGSTTTKAVLCRLSDDLVLASAYLPTNGNPVEASRYSFRSLLESTGRNDLEVPAIGVTGSGRRIAGLLSLTGSVVNEIIAHAAAAAHVDPDVDTIFEIGGQDAKYTRLEKGIAVDSAMNEACSAGTGSFLEESARESFGVPMEGIAALALRGTRPPNFSDQCAAHISADIKIATHEGIGREDILAGLVYSVCFNYVNRIVGSRPVGQRLFLQGGVCLNRAVPPAMASILRRPIIVPPEPGLMGAIGAALETKARLERGVLSERRFSLAAIAGRTLAYERPLVCRGGRERCSMRCTINRVRLEGRIHTFGGACGRHAGIRDPGTRREHGRDLVHELNLRYSADNAPIRSVGPGAPAVGISTSFLNARFAPLYRTFFSRLGCRIVLPDRIRAEAIHRRGTSLCFPAQQAMGLYADLLEQRPDWVFMPHLPEVFVPGGIERKWFCSTCLFVQGEPFWMRQAFAGASGGCRLLCPTVDFGRGYDAAEPAFLSVAGELGYPAADARIAYRAAVEAQRRCDAEIEERGRKELAELAAHPDRTALVLFGRVYGAYSPLANKGIPRKLASRGVTIMPIEMLPLEGMPIPEEYTDDMHWEAGQRILRAADFVARNRQLFGLYITYFLCAHDSFLVSYFRRLMGTKPSLTLELDEHTADAGIATRIEAFLEIIDNRHSAVGGRCITPGSFRPAEIVREGDRLLFVDSAGRRCGLEDPRVTMLLPSMGQLGTRALAATTARFGIRTVALPEADQDALRLGRAPAGGKECLPLHVCLGSLLKYVRDERKPGEKLILFLPTAGGDCRFGQYHVLAKQMIRERRLEDVALLTPGMEENFLALGPQWSILACRAVMASDAMDDIRNALRALAVEPENAAKVFDTEWEAILATLRRGSGRQFYCRLREAARALAYVPLRLPCAQAPLMEVTGEIFVRWDAFSNRGIVERLARKGFVVRVAPVAEWLFYVNYLIRKRQVESRFTLPGRIDFLVSNVAMRAIARRVRRILSATGMHDRNPIDVEDLMRHKRHILPDQVTGEQDLVVAATLRDGISRYCGIVSVGPFGCMHLRFGEALTAPQATVRGKKEALRAAGKAPRVPGFDDGDRIPFLCIESDGNPYPQLLDARLESFCLQAARVAERQGKVTAHLDLS
jgi:predicted CoA-substrate-specific enzyme activase